MVHCHVWSGRVVSNLNPEQEHIDGYRRETGGEQLKRKLVLYCFITTDMQPQCPQFYQHLQKEKGVNDGQVRHEKSCNYVFTLQTGNIYTLFALNTCYAVALSKCKHT